ncbi:MAG: hypothetical protein EAZ55_04415 [Cytophagales bacterium]|nr:MAG: hypothetical protein EAZ55_04415 [Cytophagales bacterium]
MNILIKNNIFFSFFLLIITFGSTQFALKSFAQNAKIEIEKTEIYQDEPFVISIIAEGDEIIHSNFPEIENFVKKSSASFSSEQIVAGKKKQSKTISQNYYASQIGTFKLPPFSIEINGKLINSPGATIKVKATDASRKKEKLNLEDFFITEEEIDFSDVKEDAFLGLTVETDEVYVGEGFTLTLSFFMALENKAYLDWPQDLGGKITAIHKKIQPDNCWEEDFDIKEVQKTEIKINNKTYFQYKLFQAVYYPLNTNTIIFPEVGLEMLKYKYIKDLQTGGNVRTAEKKMFYTTAKSIKVKELPPHPLRDKVPVGEFALQESITKLKLQTGETFDYNFTIVGKGNFSAIQTLEIANATTDFEFILADTRQIIQRLGNTVTGSKSFAYSALPKEAGKHPLKKYFQWVYFDPAKGKYDTLQSDLVLEISGSSLKNLELYADGLYGIYKQIENPDSDQETTWFAYHQSGRWVTNIFLGVLSIVSVYFMWKRKK